MTGIGGKIVSDVLHLDVPKSLESEEAIEDIYRDIATTAKDHTQYTHTDDQGSPRLMWLYSTNEYLFTEQIKSIDYERHNRTSPKNEPRCL